LIIQCISSLFLDLTLQISFMIVTNTNVLADITKLLLFLDFHLTWDFPLNSCT